MPLKPREDLRAALARAEAAGLRAGRLAGADHDRTAGRARRATSRRPSPPRRAAPRERRLGDWLAAGELQGKRALPARQRPGRC